MKQVIEILDPTADARVFYVAQCKRCGPPELPIPFITRKSRDDWADQHTSGTQHVISRLTEIRIETDEPS